MKKFFTRFVLLACVVVFAVPSLTFARDVRSPRIPSIEDRISARMDSLAERLCARIAKTPNATLPEFCDEEPPPPEDVCPNVPSDQATGPCADEECVADGGTWNGTSCDMPPPPEEPTLQFSANPESITEGQSSSLSWSSEHADSCTASNGWDGVKGSSGVEVVSPIISTTYTLECTGEGGVVSQEITVTVTPAPEILIGHVVVSEVFYDVDPAHGVNSGNSNNEWIELYNGTGEAVNLSGWKLADNNSSDVLPEGTMLSPGEFLIVTATSTTAGFWNIPQDVQIIVLGEQIGNGLAAGGDVVTLLNAEDIAVDAVSYGTNTTAFNPSVLGAAQGHSIERAALQADSDTAADWEDRVNPTPGTIATPAPSAL